MMVCKIKKIILLLCLFLSACQRALVLPTPHTVNDVGYVDSFSEKHPVKLSSVRINLPTGELYAVYPYWRLSVPYINLGIWSCNLSTKYRFDQSQHFWKPNAISLKKSMPLLATSIETPLQEQGYDIISAQPVMFESYKENARARIKLGATITDLKMNVCHLYNGLLYRSLGTIAGSAYIKVKWELYDDLLKKHLATIETDGIGQVEDAQKGGLPILIASALKQASANLGHTKKFQHIIVPDNTHSFSDSAETFSYLEIVSDIKLHTKPIQENYNFIRRGVVTIRTGTGHGSGFYINNEGYLLTNAHVVGNAKSVTVTDMSGTSYIAHVIRIHNIRDVALLKADVFNNTALALNLKDRGDLLDTVYAIGTPLNESMKTTVTEGIISNFRKRRKNELSFIQASIPLAVGNSGGPLLDANGNVIGIAVSGYGEISSDYANFIPIRDALNSLNIHITKRPNL